MSQDKKSRPYIKLVKIKNFRKFKAFTFTPNEKTNIIAGSNESGKSSLLEAIDLVINGNVKRIEALGLEKIFCKETIDSRNLTNHPSIAQLPQLEVDLFLANIDSEEFKGTNNLLKQNDFGIRLLIDPNPELFSELQQILNEGLTVFPFEYYRVRFTTFADQQLSPFKKKVSSILIDNSNISSLSANRDFINRIYLASLGENHLQTKARHSQEYRKIREEFSNKNLHSLTAPIAGATMTVTDMRLSLSTKSQKEFENDLMVYKKDIPLDEHGMGLQSFIKTEFALSKSKENFNLILIEEPENHLAPDLLKKLISNLSQNIDSQLFITTHSSQIATGLALNNMHLLPSSGKEQPVKLEELAEEETADFFKKAPSNNLIEFALAKKVILVEGPSEYLLLPLFYKKVRGSSPDNDQVIIISVGGICFKRYLDIALKLKSKVAVITDNDGDIQTNCEERYEKYTENKDICVFCGDTKEDFTFEVTVYKANEELCNNCFTTHHNTLDYMLKNKTEAAYRLLTSHGEELRTPSYIVRAINWISAE
ncbi:ATP-dependent nuclease [Turicimonas muris]|uniref:ATP-dependent endonuclease n=1 Tax=Turicimonas muris TaxID=1796652 RepID=A0A227KRN8_9BURK|nr:TOPRIM nucleotidyl transferase/hydrolase domain-containing protein [Turicimonas muris]ANU65357.1 ATP-dependent endonuclease [Burkholderiales bacterium YL45]OXE51163.1 ATP-dependent endonuclease [Turicimonas muris]QQQ96512.1 AAA family ATPase [Turicimonas muris]